MRYDIEDVTRVLFITDRKTDWAADYPQLAWLGLDTRFTQSAGTPSCSSRAAGSAARPGW